MELEESDRNLVESNFAKIANLEKPVVCRKVWYGHWLLKDQNMDPLDIAFVKYD